MSAVLPSGERPATIAEGGERIWLYPREGRGRFHSRRKYIAAFLILLYLILPWLSVSGRPLLQIDLINFQLKILGASFWPDDIRLLMPAFLGGVILIFFITASFGRIWCGYACPQTVFLEFIFAPIERFFEGSAAQRKKNDSLHQTSAMRMRKIFKHLTYFIFSFLIANTFLAYFTGTEFLLNAVTHSPAAHPFAFMFMLIDASVFYFIFAWFREQACVIVCPYARLQSVLTGRSTVVIAYDEKRGEPRAQGAERTGKGDCVDCSRCIQVCPTGIDIRQGQQLECVACAHCIDVCDEVMEKSGKEHGLIRYDSLENMNGKNTRWWGVRTFVYSFISLLLIIATFYLVSTRSPAQIKIIRSGSLPYMMIENGVQNLYEVAVINKSSEIQTISFGIDLPDGALCNLNGQSITLSPGASQRLAMVLRIPEDSISAVNSSRLLKVLLGGKPAFTESFSFLSPGRDAF